MICYTWQSICIGVFGSWIDWRQQHPGVNLGIHKYKHLAMDHITMPAGIRVLFVWRVLGTIHLWGYLDILLQFALKYLNIDIRWNIGMPDPSVEFHFRWFVGILRWHDNINLEITAFIGCVGWPINESLPMSDVIIHYEYGDAWILTL